jgi:ubiquinol-cytochrome c reductase cytochrome b subunit
MPYLDRSRVPGGAHFRPWYRAMFYVFALDMLVLGYIGYIPPTDTSIVIGQVATFIYFGLFVLLPFMSKAEDKWLHNHGLPPEVEKLMNSETREISKFPHRRRKDDLS